MDPATKSMIDNLPAATGKSLDDWFAVLDKTGLDTHTALMNHLKAEHGVSHGFANGIVLQYRNRGVSQNHDDLVGAQYAGAKAGLRPLHDALVAVVTDFGADVEITPKKASVSLRRRKQFGLIEAPSAKRLQLGLNLGDTAPSGRLLLAGGMCTHKVSITAFEEIDAELLGWLRAAYDLA